MTAKKKGKFFKRFLIYTFLLIIVLTIAGYIWLNHIIKYAVTEYGPKYTGGKIELQDVDINPFTGKYTIKGLKMYNPEGCKTEYAVFLPELVLEMPLSSLIGEKMDIDRIYLENAIIIYEGVKGGKSNFDLMCEHMDRALGYDPEAEVEETEEEDYAYEIKELELKGTKVKWSPRLVGKATFTFPLPPIKMNNIGAEEEEENGAKSMRKVIKRLNKELMKEAKEYERNNKEIMRRARKNEKLREKGE